MQKGITIGRCLAKQVPDTYLTPTLRCLVTLRAERQRATGSAAESRKGTGGKPVRCSLRNGMLQIVFEMTKGKCKKIDTCSLKEVSGQSASQGLAVYR